MKTIYAIYDNKAAELTGGVILVNADPAAIRMFSDAANDQKTLISKHVQDFDLIALGQMGDDLNIEPGFRVVLTGKAWAAAQAGPGSATADGAPGPRQPEIR